MEKNTITTADQLKEGDRFYKLKDKKKMVFEIKDVKPAWILGRRDSSIFNEIIPKKTDVVFIRNINDLTHA